MRRAAGMWGMNRTPDVVPWRTRNWPPRGRRGRVQRTGEGSMTRQLTGALRRSILIGASLAASATLAVGFASPAGAYGGGAGHDTWQVGISATATTCPSAAPTGWAAFGAGSSSTA